ncbi:MAG: hypothetical protein JRJ57_04065 [Deltaproteobacteria bacterium]|nr:hypothetical protein [Deltaproteobacteria bacterium]
MISERKFSNSFSSFWNELLPTADSFVRRMNLSLERYCLPIESRFEVNRDRRSVINELSFRFFMSLARGKKLSASDKMKISFEVSHYIERLAPNINIDQPISKEEIEESESLSSALTQYFSKDELNKLWFWPDFRGCGRINSCKGDIITGDKLVEVKAGDRRFRITDVRQVITYLSLNSISKQYDIQHIALVNPRKGLFFETTVEILIEDCSQRKPVDVFGDIVDFLSSEVVST